MPTGLTRQILPLAAIFAASISPIPLAAADSSAAGLAPHSAYYGVKLLSAGRNSGIETVSGGMAVNWDADCGGWTMTHRMELNVGYTGGRTVRIDVRAATWEALDSNRYTFAIRTAFDGREAEKIEGHAARNPGGSRAVFTLPEARKLDLPDDVLFPTAHTRKVLAAARAGTPLLSVPVFDGFGAKGAQQVSAVIGRPHPVSKIDAGRFPALAGQKMTNVRLAFYGNADTRADPDSEIGIQLSDTGIARNLELDFSDFTINAELDRLKLGKKPACAD